MSARLAAVRVGGSSAPWQAAGFALDADGRVALANGALTFAGGGDRDVGGDVGGDGGGGRDGGDGGGRDGMVGLAIAGLAVVPDDLEGVPLATGSICPGIDHPNGAFELDHVVVMTDSLERTSAAVTDALGLECRRIRETDTVRQAFHRFADQGGVRGCIIEVVESPRVHSTGLFGLVVNVVDLDAAAAELGPDVVGRARKAVQPGRRIATIRGGAGLGVPVALMTPG